MRLQILREFLVIAETLNFSTAADKLFISQATLSKHMQALEHKFDASLFTRSTRRVELTELGQQLLPYARRAAELEADILQAVENYHESRFSYLNIGCVNRWDGIDLGRLTMDFQKAHPHTCLSFTTDETSQLVSMLENDKYHFIIIREMPDILEDGLTRLLLCEDPLYAFLPAGHPLASEDRVQLSQLRQDPFLMSNEGSLSYKLSIKACMDAGFSPNIIYRGGHPQAMNYLAHGLGVALMFRNPMDPLENSPGLAIRPLGHKVYAKINLVYKESSLTDAGLAFLKFMKRYKI